MQVAEAQAIGVQFFTVAAEFIVYGVAVVNDEISCLGSIAPAAYHEDAGPFIYQHCLCQMGMLVHAPGHFGRLGVYIAEIIKARLQSSGEEREGRAFDEVLQHDAFLPRVLIPKV